MSTAFSLCVLCTGLTSSFGPVSSWAYVCQCFFDCFSWRCSQNYWSFVALLQLLCHVWDVTWAFSSYDNVYPVSPFHSCIVSSSSLQVYILQSLDLMISNEASLSLLFEHVIWYSYEIMCIPSALYMAGFIWFWRQVFHDICFIIDIFINNLKYLFTTQLFKLIPKLHI